MSAWYATRKYTCRASSTCGQEGTSVGCGCGLQSVDGKHHATGIALEMDALVFLLQVVRPMAVEASVGAQGTELEDGLGALRQPPSGVSDDCAVLPRW